MRVDELSVKPLTYHDTLNPLLWDSEKLKPEIRNKLLQVARHFAEFLDIPRYQLKDITVSGSNAAYGYSEYSDIDLHLVVDISNPAQADLFTAKKNHYNTTYNIKVKGIDVELYAQDSKQVHHSAGIYSVMNDQWISEPKHEIPQVSANEIKSKARNYAGRINQALRGNDLNTARETMDNIRRLRKAGLEQGGEYSVENLAFKLLRARGQIDKLVKHIDKLQSAELSIGEQT